jgi:hypothetical protein
VTTVQFQPTVYAFQDPSDQQTDSPPPLAIPGYRILKELGGGGMGVVYKARHLELNRIVALNMILSGEWASAQEIKRFRAEAETIAQFRHLGIIEIFEIGEHEGRLFFSLEYCSGGSLECLLRGTPLPPAEAARLLVTLAGAIAHLCGVIHRDLKPANVLLQDQSPHAVKLLESKAAQPGGGTDPAATATVRSLGPQSTFVPKITDFGLAKTLNESGQAGSRIASDAEGRRNKGLASQRIAQGGQQVRGQATFDNIAEGPGRASGKHIIWVPVHGQKHQLRVGAGRHQLLGRLDAVESRHRDVEHHEVRLKAGRFVHQRVPVVDGLDYLIVRFEESRDDRKKALVIVGQEYTSAGQLFNLLMLGEKPSPSRHPPGPPRQAVLHNYLTILWRDGYW